VRDVIAQTMSTFTVPGAQVAWLCNGSIEQISCGSMGQGRSLPVVADTRFPLGSLTKAFTASLALQLVGDGALNLDDPICRALPPGRCRATLRDVSLRQLLSHTSGLEDDSANWRAASSVREYVRCIGEDRLFSPGEHFSYANAGYIIAGYLIEGITGQSWAESLQAFLLDALEVQGTFFLSESVGPGVMVDGHVRRRDGEIARLPGCTLGRALAPAAGLALSATQVLQFVQLHLSGGRTRQGFQLLDPSLVAEMQTSQVEVPDSSFADEWGLGWSLHRTRSGPARGSVWFGHDGDTEGSAAYLRASADQSFAIALVVNCIPAQDEWRRLLAALTLLGLHVGDTWCPELPKAPPPISPSLAGRYENSSMRFTIKQSEDALWMEVGNEDRRELRPIAPDRCLVMPNGTAAAPFPVVFLRDGEGNVRYVQCLGRVARRAA
jgi:CubicO group peptidase (beta-lactamase class C family)